jgi:hypothetical protein
LLAGYLSLNRFHLFKWQYRYGNEKKSVPFSQIVISDEQLRLTAEYNQAIKNVPHSIFILDRYLFDYLTNDVRYFHSIRMVTDHEKELIRKDLYDLLDYLEEVASISGYPETFQKVDLYISQLNIDTNYSYTFTNQANTCFIHVFDKFEIYTQNTEMTENFRTWMQLKKRTSIQISGVDEKYKIEFFGQQRQLVDEL